MSKRRGERSAAYLRSGDIVEACDPSLRAYIKNGQRYVVDRTEQPDSMGYVWLRDIPEPYRPYLVQRVSP